jgi:uncharacterized protein (TIGR02246 family)
MTADEGALLDAFEALYAAAAAKDGDALDALFAGDADVTFWGSEQAEKALGPGEVSDFMAAISSSATTFEFRWDRRRPHIDGDVAWVNAAGECEWSGADGQSGTLPYRVTGVFVRRDGRWLWHTHHGSEPGDD